MHAYLVCAFMYKPQYNEHSILQLLLLSPYIFFKNQWYSNNILNGSSSYITYIIILPNKSKLYIPSYNNVKEYCLQFQICDTDCENVGKVQKPSKT